MPRIGREALRYLRAMTSSFKRCAGRVALVLIAGATAFSCSARFVPELDAGADASVPGSVNDADADAAPPDTSTGVDSATPAVDAGPLACAADTFPVTVMAAEASAATVVDLQGSKRLFVIGDSGNAGRGALVDLTTTAATAGQVLLDASATDDIEAMAFHGGRLYTLTSAGAVRESTVFGTNFVAMGSTYRIGAVPFSCPDLLSGNCAKDYEGLCLRGGAPAPDGCAGYAASKSDGALYCVTMDVDGHLAVRATEPIRLGLPANSLSDCAFGAEGSPYDQVLLVATNGNNANRAYRVDATTGAKTILPTPAATSLEAIALDGEGRVYLFSDTDVQSSPSLRFTCGPWR